MKQIILILFVLTTLSGVAQDFPEKEILKKLKADKIEVDEGNEDGVFKARNKKNQKWGMFQWMSEGTKMIELVPMQYDSLNYFPYNGNFTAVYNRGKVGFYLSHWTYGDMAKQTVPCIYEAFQRYTPEDGIIRLAVRKGGKWGWVDWLTGEEKTEFIYYTKEDLPYPNWEQKY